MVLRKDGSGNPRFMFICDNLSRFFRILKRVIYTEDFSFEVGFYGKEEGIFNFIKVI